MRPSSELRPADVRWLHQLDQWRRTQGRWLAAAGYAPVETPHRLVHAETGLRLRCYGGSGPPLLIVPAPIKQPYIWDLLPRVSVVQHALRRGWRVYLAEWTEHQADMGLADYADRLLSVCADRIAAETGDTRVLLAGHSLGGVLAALFACLHAPRLRALVLLEAPLHTDPERDRLARLTAAAPDAHAIARQCGTVPGSLLNAASAAAVPQAFQLERYQDFLRSLVDREAWTTHMRVERWSRDEFALPGRLFAEVIDGLYRQDALLRGRLRLGTHTLGPAHLVAPLISVLDPRSEVIPPPAVERFHAAAASPHKLLLQYEGDVGVAIQHVGVLVGRQAHARVWPAIFDWLHEVGAASADSAASAASAPSVP